MINAIKKIFLEQKLNFPEETTRKFLFITTKTVEDSIDDSHISEQKYSNTFEKLQTSLKNGFKKTYN